jgi:hypothetical protein
LPDVAKRQVEIFGNKNLANGIHLPQDDPLGLLRIVGDCSKIFALRGRPRPTKGKSLKKETSKRLTREQLAELKSLAALPDSAIDTSDAPELLDWSGAKRGVFYRPVNSN